VFTPPWRSIDFTTDPQGYADAVLAYCLEGNLAVDFKVQDNAVRKWYHVPWLHYGPSGRDWRRGMTKERFSRPNELYPGQLSASTAAVGFYNDVGGYTIGQVWPDCGSNIPAPRASEFREGAVSFKLLFTTANESSVPYLRDPIHWTSHMAPFNSDVRSDLEMNLLQIDIAVKDPDSPVGWVFGTFVYDGTDPAPDRWARFKLVGLSWGVDAGVASRKDDFTAFINPDIVQSWLNPALIGDQADPVPAARIYHVGLGGRLNGPVDNKISSCISCHGKAAVLKDMEPDPIEWIGQNPKVVPSLQNDVVRPESFVDYFGSDVPPGSGDITYNCFVSSLRPSNCTGVQPMHEFVCTDYSLQLAVGIENYYSAITTRAQEFMDERSKPRNDE